MADVRSLLRAERAARAPPKTRKQPPTSPPKPNKKRKADDDDSTNNESRKRTKAKGSTNLPSGFFDRTEEPEQEKEEEVEEPQPLEGFVAATEAPPALPQSTSNPTARAKDIDDEWAAFEQDIASIPAQSKSTLDVLNASAILEAAPISAAEAASQSLEGEASTQKGRREEEIEAEKEDAARALEEEFEEMEVLEERLKRLKEKREQLRAGKSKAAEHLAAQSETMPEVGSDDDDENDGDEWDGWRFGTS
jgi:hypothetical protein